MKLHHIALLLAGISWASGAQADEGALSPSSSSGSVTISVYILPLGAALAAHKDGAVGLWSVSGRNSGLMIKLHRDQSERGFDAVSVLSRAEVGVEAEWLSGRRGNLQTPVQNLGGLNTATLAVLAGTAPIRTLMIRGI